MPTIRDTRAQIIDAWRRLNPADLLGVEGMWEPEIAAWLGLDEDRVFRAIDALVTEGWLTREPGGLHCTREETPLPRPVEAALQAAVRANGRRILRAHSPEVVAVRCAVIDYLGARATRREARILGRVVADRARQVRLPVYDDAAH